jgi:hypothetical protein
LNITGDPEKVSTELEAALETTARANNVRRWGHPMHPLNLW